MVCCIVDSAESMETCVAAVEGREGVDGSKISETRNTKSLLCWYQSKKECEKALAETENPVQLYLLSIKFRHTNFKRSNILLAVEDQQASFRTTFVHGSDKCVCVGMFREHVGSCLVMQRNNVSGNGAEQSNVWSCHVSGERTCMGVHGEDVSGSLAGSMFSSCTRPTDLPAGRS
jgi:hypothetical protein